jgi:hypothetical protein
MAIVDSKVLAYHDAIRYDGPALELAEVVDGEVGPALVTVLFSAAAADEVEVLQSSVSGMTKSCSTASTRCDGVCDELPSRGRLLRALPRGARTMITAAAR